MQKQVTTSFVQQRLAELNNAEPDVVIVSPEDIHVVQVGGKLWYCHDNGLGFEIDSDGNVTWEDETQYA